MNKSFLLLFFKKEVLALPCLAFLIAATTDPVIARRGNEQITASQARALISTTDHATQQRLTTDKAALETFLRDVLVQRAILHLAHAEKWDQRPDVAALLRRTHDQILAQSFLAGHSAPPATYPSDAEVHAAYKENISRFMQPRSYHIAQLFLPGAATTGAEDGRRRLQQARAQVERGMIALEVAARSLAGAQYIDMGWVPETQLLPAIRPVVTGLLEGAIASPICMDNGCHLIRLLATRPAGSAPLANIRDDLVRAMRQQKASREATAYASGLLLKEPVEINEIQVARMVR
jgi:peptidylprolyl isomerase